MTVLKKIQPLHAEKVPPAGAVPAGMTEQHQQLYRLKRMRSRGVPDIDKDTGERRFRKHQTTGEQMYGLNVPELYEEDLLFFLESEGNGNVRLVPYVPPTVEQLAAEEREKKIAAVKDQLAELLVDSGVTPQQLLAGVRPQTLERLDIGEPVAPPEPEPEIEYPIDKGGGWWLLSNGQQVQAKKGEVAELEAAAAEQRKQAREHAEQTPEV